MKKFFIDGYVCGTIDTRTTQSGKQVTTFSVNSPDRRKNNSTGEYENFPQFFNCQYWHRFDNDFRAASIVEKAHVVMTGDLRYESWEKDGRKGSKVLLNVTDIWSAQDGQKGHAAKPEYVQASYIDGSSSLYDEDLPF